MNNCNYTKLLQDGDSFTQATTTLIGDTFLDITPSVHEDSFVALSNRATNELSYLHFTQANLGLQTLESSELVIPPYRAGFSDCPSPFAYSRICSTEIWAIRQDLVIFLTNKSRSWSFVRFLRLTQAFVQRSLVCGKRSCPGIRQL